MTQNSQQTKTIKKDLAVKETKIEKNRISRLVGTFLIIISGIILYTDKILGFYNIELENLHGWKTSEVFVWTLCQTISPIIIMLAMYLRPYFWSLSIPIFSYSLQYYFVMDSNLNNDNPLTWIYTTISTILLILIFWFVKKKIKKLDELRNLKIDMLEKMYKNN
jgi:cell division protein FtsL